MKACVDIPAALAQREAIRARVRDYAAGRRLVPPLSMEELRAHAAAVCAAMGDGAYERFVTVLLGNEIWRATMARIPYERRVLLLPQCLRDRSACPAEIDEMGLLCEECGRCPIGAIQAQAEALGYVVLVAEGTTVVTRLLESGKVDAVIGVSCLATLEKSFPHMAADAIPGMAIPLITEGCDGTTVDADWVRELIALKSDEPWTGRLDLDEMRAAIRRWFEPAPLAETLGAPDGAAEALCHAWLACSGKRWRPLLAACAYKALSGDADPAPAPVRALAVAVECFHKASLVHDDIEDDDDFRYGRQTLHREHGLPVALNAGDLLLGEGYRLIARCGAEPALVVRMLAVAADGHRSLCLGQGAELAWTRRPAPIDTRAVLEIFRRKTAPAFEVALALGALRAGADEEVARVLARFSESLGIAYQVRDDLLDFEGAPDGGDDAAALRPSLPMALACEHGSGPDHAALLAALSAPAVDRAAVAARVRRLVAQGELLTRARQWIEHYKNEAVRSLTPLEHAPLKGLLRRTAGRILEAKGIQA